MHVAYDKEFPVHTFLTHPHLEQHVLLTFSAWKHFRASCNAIDGADILAELRSRFSASVRRAPGRHTREYNEAKYGGVADFFRDSISRFRFTLVPHKDKPDTLVLVNAFRYPSDHA